MHGTLRCYQFLAFVRVMFIASMVIGFGVHGWHVAWVQGVLFSIVAQQANGFLLEHWSNCDSFRDWVGNDLFEEWSDGEDGRA